MFKRTRKFFSTRYVRGQRKVETLLNLDEARGNLHTMQDMARRVTKTAPGREETFANAYQRLKLDEAQLAQTHRYHSFRFYLFSVFFTVATGIFLFSLVRGDWFTLAPSLGSMALLAALAFQASFTLFKIERRAFMPVSEWLHTPSSWIPAPFQPQAHPSDSTSLRR